METRAFNEGLVNFNQLARTVCRPALVHNGKYNYDCDKFEGLPYSPNNPVSIVWVEKAAGRAQWLVQKNMSAARYVAEFEADSNPHSWLYEWTVDHHPAFDHVCIPARSQLGNQYSMMTKFGMIKCRDDLVTAPLPVVTAPLPIETAPLPMAQTTEAVTTGATKPPVTTEATPASSAPAPSCSDLVLNTLLVGEGSWRCKLKKARNGQEKVFKCDVKCSDGTKHQGPRFARCKTFNYKTKAGEQRKGGVWYTNKNRKMRC